MIIEDKKYKSQHIYIDMEMKKMASVRIRGVGAKIDDKKVLQKAKQIRDTFGSDFKIIIEKNHITVEGKMTHEERKKIDQILAS